MTAMLHIQRAGPALSLQDMGRPGYEDRGLSPGGAADPLALIEAAVLLDASAPLPAIEMAGLGGQFTVTAPTRFALTGAPMGARLDGQALIWNASHRMEPGQVLDIGGVQAGSYGYLSFVGGIMAPRILGSVATHFAAGIGGALAAGQAIPLGTDPDATAPAQGLPLDARFDGGAIRVMPGPQSGLFDFAVRERFFNTPFTRAAQANRQGVQLDYEGAPFAPKQIVGLASDFVRPGDIQMTGQGQPVVLLCEAQTMGGYPRLGTVVPADLPRVAQAPAGAALSFVWVGVETGDGLPLPQMQSLRAGLRPLLRDPADICDLLSYQLISGATAGHDL